MSHPSEPNQVAAALDYLRSHNRFFAFDNQERVVHVAIYDATNADEIAAHVGHLRDVQNLTFERTDLTDEGLRHLGGLADLRELWLCGSRVTATGLACLGSMSHLQDVYINAAQDLDLEAFKCISRLQNLLRLTLSGGTFCDADLAPLAALANADVLREYVVRGWEGEASVREAINFLEADAPAKS